MTVSPTLPPIEGEPFFARSAAPLSEQAALLLQEAAADRWGDLSPSVYETARLVADVPWLGGHEERIAFVLATQRADGGWGPPNDYALVPTLSAVRALLTCLVRGDVPADGVLDAAVRGLGSLTRQLDGPADPGGRPDMIAIELTVPALILDVRALLGRVDAGPYAGRLRGLGAIGFPPGLGPETLLALRAAHRTGRPVPGRIWHSWEALGIPAAEAPYVRPRDGAVAISAAATAAWLGAEPPPSGHPSAGYLELVQRRGNGIIPTAGPPATYYERAWVLGALGTSGLPCAVPPALLDSLEDGLTAEGAPAAPGLPPDADDTAAVLLALSAYGRVHRPDALLDYFAGDHFQCFPGERTPSTSTNAHALETLAHHTARRPADAARYAAAMNRAADWQLAAQLPEGCWTDKWHASPYYATACAVLALTASGPTPAVQRSLRRAAAWVLAGQRADGGWGRWASTVEETAYGVRVLGLAAPLLPARHVTPALSRACLLLADPAALVAAPTPLWHGKDLYAPYRIIRATRLAALHESRGRA